MIATHIKKYFYTNKNLNMHKFFLISVLLLNFSLFSQTNWYVNYQNGNNSNAGTSVSTAVKTIDYLTSNNLIQPSDTVFIIGEYHNESYNPNFVYGGDNDRNNPHIWHQENSVRLNNLHGEENQYITFKPYDNNTVLKGDGANIFKVVNCSYLKIEGFEIYGEVENIPLSTAEGLITDGLQFLYLDPNTVDPKHPTLSEVLYRVRVGTPINEIENTTYPILGPVTRPSYTDTRGLFVSHSHHIEIVGNEIHHTCGGGLRVAESSYVNIYENNIHNCSRRSYAGTHGLVVTKAEEGLPNNNDDTTYSTKIERNTVHYNYNELFSWSPKKDIITPRIDEGKGISLQRNNSTDWIDGNKRILIANNICFWNGYSGVHSNEGWHIDYINNTCYMNSYTNTVTYANGQQGGKQIGISTQEGDDIRIFNNISVIDTDWNGFPISSGGTTNLVVENNLIYGVNGSVSQDSDVTAIQVNTIIADPLFIDETNFNFNLQQNSPAINSANSDYAPVDDFYGNRRDVNPDLGAIEYIAPLGISDFNQKEINIFPNPFTHKIIINKRFTKNDIMVYNMLGQNIKNSISISPINQSTILDMEKLPEGMYLIKTPQFAKIVYKKSKE
jgi:hypothetical protein